MQELIIITQKALQSQSWKMKAQGAAAMASIAKQAGSLVPPHLGIVLSALLQGLPGRTWTGKVTKELAPCEHSMKPLSLEMPRSVLHSSMSEPSFRESACCLAFSRYKNVRSR